MLTIVLLQAAVQSRNSGFDGRVAFAECRANDGGETVQDLLHRLWQKEEGQDLAEYGLMLALIALACVASIGTLSNILQDVFSTTASTLSAGRPFR
jgi:pilus assembly protein Flp/PilA